MSYRYTKDTMVVVPKNPGWLVTAKHRETGEQTTTWHPHDLKGRAQREVDTLSATHAVTIRAGARP